MIEVVKTVEDFAKRSGVSRIDTLILQIGELSSVVPQYVKACYPAAVDGTMLEETKLNIEILPGNAVCKACGDVFNLLKDGKTCPKCGCGDWELLSGREFMIKEIIAC
jgi:hydrogenase nickel incorporation protein HypA/HybF